MIWKCKRNNDWFLSDFHDCVGGCNGCIDESNDDNAGLSEVVAWLDDIRSSNSYDSLVSKADFYALAGTVAISWGVKNSNVLRGKTA